MVKIKSCFYLFDIVVIMPYELEEQDCAIMGAVRGKKLRKRETTAYTKMYFQAAGQDWCHINNGIQLCAVDCTGHMNELTAGFRGEKIYYLVDETTVISNGEHPVAIVTDATGRILYESPGYRMAMSQSEPE